ncbi:hypothetical protein KUV39_08730 [Phaeobacter italicus]|uniref:hypothetical protein n=1 Tax=Phaeobacter italicus TaxID=481446 RepID=UPI001C95F957|nr:hypothetical protein [Phaeobacter italicus]MBY5976730.1 hypothetical protein [Phaeobacter italicus]
MDFNKFDSVSAAEKGAAMHIKDPTTLEPLFTEDGKPCEIILLGSEAPSVRAAYREAEKARLNAEKAEGTSDAEGDDAEFLSMDDFHEKTVELLLPRVVGFNNVFKGDKPATKKDAPWFFGLNRMNGQKGEKSFAEQASDFSAKRASYLGNVSTA